MFMCATPSVCVCVCSVEVEEEVRVTVDQLMREELKNLKLVRPPSMIDNYLPTPSIPPSI